MDENKPFRGIFGDSGTIKADPPMPHVAQPLDEQAAHLQQLIQQIRELFSRGSYTLPAHLFDQLNQFSDTLARLTQQVSALEKDKRRLQSLVEISQIISSTMDLDAILCIVVDALIDLTHSERGFLILRSPRGGLEVRIARNWQKETVHPSDYAISKAVIQQVIKQSKPVLTDNAKEDPRFNEEDGTYSQHLRSILCVPLKLKGQLLGMIYADHRTRTGLFSEAERDLLAAFASQASIAVESAGMFERQRRNLAEIINLKNLTDNVFSSIASGVVTTDPDDCITLSNRTASETLGFKGESLVGRRIRDVFPPDAESVRHHIAQVWNDESARVGIEILTTLPNQRTATLLLRLSPLRKADQKMQGVAIVIDDISELKHLEARHRLFERMVAPAVISQLDPNQLPLGGQRAVITTLFADLRGFTGLSERLPPEQLISTLNIYLSAAAEAVLAQQGTIDKFQGDGVMAWFNAPIPQPDHTLRAIRAAIDLKKRSEAIQQHLPAELRLSFGTGIHCGEAVLGLVGTERRLDYTAIGDSINTAKRIQEAASPGQILISAETYLEISNRVIVRQADPLQARGKSFPITVYEVLGMV